MIKIIESSAKNPIAPFKFWKIQETETPFLAQIPQVVWNKIQEQTGVKTLTPVELANKFLPELADKLCLNAIGPEFKREVLTFSDVLGNVKLKLTRSTERKNVPCSEHDFEIEGLEISQKEANDLWHKCRYGISLSEVEQIRKELQ